MVVHVHGFLAEVVMPFLSLTGLDCLRQFLPTERLAGCSTKRACTLTWPLFCAVYGVLNIGK